MNRRKGIVALSVLFFLVTATTFMFLTFYLKSRNLPINKSLAANQIIITDSPINGDSKLQMRTFRVVSLTSSPSNNILPTATLPLSRDREGVPTLPAGGYYKRYCVDDNPGPDIVPCDNVTRCDHPQGAGGPYSTCGTVMSWEHKLIRATDRIVKNEPASNSLWNNLSETITSNCSTAPATANYISTYNIVDAYNLAGFTDLTRSTHASAATMQAWWQSAEASALGYKFSPGTSMTGVGPGYVMFFASGHVAMVNHVQIDLNGNGKMTYLHTGSAFYLGVGSIVSNNLVQTSAGEAVTGFGGHQTVLPYTYSEVPACASDND